MEWALPPEHLWAPLWDLNRRQGPFIVTTVPLVNLRDYPSLTEGQVIGQISQRSFVFPIINRYTDETGQMWLHLWHPRTGDLQPPLGDRDWLPPYRRLFQTTEEIWIAADYVELSEVGREGRSCPYGYYWLWPDRSMPGPGVGGKVPLSLPQPLW